MPFLFTAFLAAVVYAHASGRPENAISRAEALIDRQQYDDAIRVLAEVIRKDPEMFDAAQALVEKIRHVQNGFNTLYQELLTVLYEERDVEKALKIIDELEKLDPNPNRATRDAIAQARLGALIQANRNRFDALMDKALALLDGGDVAGALGDYLGAFDFFREEFESSSLGNVTKDPARAAIASVRDSVASYLQISASFAQDNANLASSIATGGEGLVRLMALQRQRLARMAETVVTAERAVSTLAGVRGSLPEGVDVVGYFLYYCEKAIAGRPGRETGEGIARAESVGVARGGATVAKALRVGAEGGMAAALAAYRSGDWQSSVAKLQALHSLMSAMLEFAYLADARHPLDPGYDPGKAEGLLLAPDLPTFVAAQELYREQEAYITLASAHIAADQGRTERGWDPVSLTEAIATVQGFAEGWQSYSTKLAAVSPELGRQAYEVASAAAEALQQWRAGAYASLEAPVAAIETSEQEQGRLLREGESERLADGRTRVVFYPERRIAALKALDARATDVAGKVRGMLGSDRAADAGPASAASAAPLQGLLDRTNAAQDRIAADLAEATSLAVSADSYRRQGDNEYRAAQAALGRAQYADARAALDRAAEAYARSLEKQEDPAVRDLRDRVLPALLAQINDAENNRVVTDVRKLINDAVAAYRRAEFQQAKKSLVQAETRWKDTNTGTNAEIDTWMALVERALATQQGWELVETQPRYREIAQLLKFASDDFARGEALEAQKEPVRAQVAFTAAQEKLDTISRAVPRLKSANFLRLKITQKLEPAVFGQQLAEVKQRARTALSSRAPAALTESYSELTDFAHVVPDDRGLADLIVQMEIALGRRPAPPDPQKIARSQASYVEAKRIFDNRLSDQYPEAVRLCDEAIAAYPENRDAAALKDALLIRTGGGRQDIISSDDRREYLRAEKLFSDGNFPEAYNIVRLLLQKPANKGYPPLNDLKAKLERRLGIQ